MTDECVVRRSKIPENQQRRLAAISHREAEKFRQAGKRKLAKNALEWEKHFLEEANRLAQRTTVVHWRPVPKGTCQRKDSNIDEVRVNRTLTKLASASHLENVDCLVCRRWARNRNRKVKRSKHHDE